MQKIRCSLPTTLPLFFLNVEEAVKTKVKNSTIIVPVNNALFNIEYRTPTGRVKTLKAKFQAKDKNAIFYDRWQVRGRTTFIKHGSNVRILSKI